MGHRSQTRIRLVFSHLKKKGGVKNAQRVKNTMGYDRENKMYRGER